MPEAKKSHGLIFDIQDYGVGDGPGVRTVVFLKGCRLRCPWCANPEGQRSEIELMHSRHRCQKCYSCVSACSYGVISVDSIGYPAFNRRICSKCKDKPCEAACPNKAIRIVGQKFNAKELYDRVKRGSLFFRNSGGGVTLSGGEPLLRTDFVKEFLGECGRIGLSVGVETCGMFDWEEVVPFVSQFDFLYYDIKCMDPILHKKIIGADNDKILANLRKVVETNTKNILITVPVIPGFNDSNENIRATAQLCRQLHIEKITLLAYHSMGAGKYEELGRKYPMGDKAAPPSSLLERLKVIVAKEGITCVSE